MKSVRHVLWTFLWIIVILVGSEWLLDNGWPWRISSLEPYMNRRANDDWTHNAFEIQRIKNRDRDMAGETIVFLGGSVGIEVIRSDDEESREISSLTGKPTYFKSICATYQTPADHAKIIKELGSFGGTVLIAIEPLTFKATQDRQLWQVLKNGNDHLKYYYLDSFDAINDILLKHGYDVRWDQKFRLVRTARVLGEVVKKRAMQFVLSLGKKRHIIWDRHAVSDRTPIPKKKIEGSKKWVRRLHTTYEYVHELNLDLLRLSIDIAKGNGNRVVLVDLPTNPAVEEGGYDLFEPHYGNMIRELLNEKDVEYIDMRQAAEWTPEDFKDPHHMRTSGDMKFTPALAKKLVNYLEVAGYYGGSS